MSEAARKIDREANAIVHKEAPTPEAIPPGVAEKLDERQRRFEELDRGFGHKNTAPWNRGER